MALTNEQIAKYRHVYATTSNELAKKTAKEKLEANGIPLTEPKKDSSEKKTELSKEQIEKYRKMYATTTNALAKKTAKDKLEAAGVSLTETKKEEKAPEKTEKTEKTAPADKAPMFRYKSKDDYKDAVAGILKNNMGMDEGRVKEILDHAKIKTILDEAYSEKWQAKLAAKHIKAAELKRAKMASNGKEEEFDCEELIAKAKKERQKKKEYAKKRQKTEPKTPAGKNRNTIEKTVEKVDKEMTERAKKGKVTPAEIKKAIQEYKDAIKKLEALYKKVMSGKKFEDGGNIDSEVDVDDAKEFNEITSGACGCSGKMAKGGNVSKNKNKEFLSSVSSEMKSSILKNIANHYGISEIEAEKEIVDAEAENIYEYIGNNPTLRKKVYDAYAEFLSQYKKGGKVKGWKHKAKKRKLDPESDNQFSAEKAGSRTSRKYASVETRGGGVYHRRNANQFGKVKGGNEYREYRENRTDNKRFLETGGYSDKPSVRTHRNFMGEYIKNQGGKSIKGPYTLNTERAIKSHSKLMCTIAYYKSLEDNFDIEKSSKEFNVSKDVFKDLIAAGKEITSEKKYKINPMWRRAYERNPDAKITKNINGHEMSFPLKYLFEKGGNVKGWKHKAKKKK